MCTSHSFNLPVFSVEIIQYIVKKNRYACTVGYNFRNFYMHICFSSHCIVLFPLRTPASWRSAKCTRRLFKVWRNWPNWKLICYSERGDHRLSFEYKFVGQPWKCLKLYPTVHAYLFFFTLYCIISTENTGKLKECEVHTEAL